MCQSHISENPSCEIQSWWETREENPRANLDREEKNLSVFHLELEIRLNAMAEETEVKEESEEKF